VADQIAPPSSRCMDAAGRRALDRLVRRLVDHLGPTPYTFRVDGRDKGGNRTIVDKRVLVDRTIRSVTWSDRSFDPRAGQHSRASIVLRRHGVITVGIYRGNTLVRPVWTATSLGAGTYTRTWDGRTASGAFATAGTYRIKVTARSWIGTTTYSRNVVVERH